jgi:hypothetical protein
MLNGFLIFLQILGGLTLLFLVWFIWLRWYTFKYLVGIKHSIDESRNNDSGFQFMHAVINGAPVTENAIITAVKSLSKDDEKLVVEINDILNRFDVDTDTKLVVVKCAIKIQDYMVNIKKIEMPESVREQLSNISQEKYNRIYERIRLTSR